MILKLGFTREDGGEFAIEVNTENQYVCFFGDEGDLANDGSAAIAVAGEDHHKLRHVLQTALDYLDSHSDQIDVETSDTPAE